MDSRCAGTGLYIYVAGFEVLFADFLMGQPALVHEDLLNLFY